MTDLLQDAAASLIVLILLGSVMLGVKCLEKRFNPELCRKLVHVVMGLIAATLPWVIVHRITVVVLAGVACMGLLALRLMNATKGAGLGSVLYGVRRLTSYGELVFPISIAVMFWYTSDNKLVYVIPLLILTFADSLAALVGLRYGQKALSSLREDQKTMEGLLAFFFVAFLCTQTALMLFSNLTPLKILLISVLIGVLSAMVEVTSNHGMDNLLVPILSFIFLKSHLELSVQMLFLNMIYMIVIIMIGFFYNQFGYMSKLGVLTGVLAAYVALLLGGIPWFIGPLMLFLGYCIVPMMTEVEKGKVIDSHIVKPHITVPLVLLCTGSLLGKPELFYLNFFLCFGLHLAFNTYIRLNCYCQNSRGQNCAITFLKSMAMLLLPGLVVGLVCYRDRTAVALTFVSQVFLGAGVWVIATLSRRVDYTEIRARNYWVHTAIVLGFSLVYQPIVWLVGGRC